MKKVKIKFPIRITNYILTILSTILSLILILIFNKSLWWLIILTPFITYLGLLIIEFIFFFFLSFIYSYKKEYKTPSKLCNKLINICHELLLDLFLVNIDLKIYEELPKDSKFLIVSNHKSGFDSMLLAYSLRKYSISFISKESNFKIPFCRRYMNRNLYLKIDRDNDFEALKTIIKASNLLKKDVINIGVFPEGTRSKDNKLLEFKAGSLNIATKSKKPIVVMSIKNSNKIFKNFPFKFTKCEISILKILDNEELDKKTTVLANEIESIIAKDLNIE